MKPEVEILVRVIDQAYDHRSWHGTNLRGSIRGMSAEFAARRPVPGRHNAWEIVVHAAYWKYAVFRRLIGAKRGSFPLKGSDWFDRPDTRTGPLEVAWRADLALLAEMHRALRDVVAQFPVRSLHRKAAGSSFTNADLIAGAAAHDLYHAGQIQLLKRLLAPAPDAVAASLASSSQALVPEP
jgi:uncharacterized damage-inducible protein DinB